MGHDERPPLRLSVRLLDNWGRIGSNYTSNGHEEAVIRDGQHMRAALRRRVGTDPKVAPDPAMYWPRVRMIPFGPAP